MSVHTYMYTFKSSFIQPVIHFPVLYMYIDFSTACIGNRKICLLIDKNEREKGRLLKFAEDKGIDAQTRYLPAGDYIWILTPPMIDTRQKYTGNQSAAEVVCLFTVYIVIKNISS